MNSRWSLVLGSLCVAFGLSLVACGSSSTEGDAAKGEQAVTTRKCKDCHGADMAGSKGKLDAVLLMHPDTTVAYAANLTPDEETGIGGWTDEQIDKAIRKGIDDEGETLCEPMPVYSTMADDEVANIIAYLKELKAVKHEAMESSCAAAK